MKVLHIINSLSGGGRERRMAQLVYGLSSYDDICQDIIVLVNKNDYFRDSKNVNIHVVGEVSKPVRLWKYFKLLRDFKPHIVHMWLETPFELLLIPILCRLFRTKCIAGFVADGNSYPKFSVINIVTKICFALADAVVSNSKAGLLAKNAPITKSYVIYNGFDFSRFDNIDGVSLREKENIVSKYVVTMCARFTAAKDWVMFVNLAKMSTDDDITFLAVGDGVSFGSIENLVKESKLSNIRLLGRRTDVENLLDASDVSVLFSNNNTHKEGVSNSILEAMAAGKPVIATIGGGTDEIVEDEVTGYLIKPGDVTTAYIKLKDLLNNEDLRHNMGANANNMVRKKFLLSEMAQNYIDLYSKVL